MGRYPVRRVVIVNLKTGDALKGVLWKHGPRCLVLRETPVIPILFFREGSTKPRKLDNETLVYRRDVRFIQVMR